MVIINYIYDMPFFKANKGLSSRHSGGWELRGAAQFQTGTPCGIGTNNDYAGVGEVRQLRLRLGRASSGT